MDSLVSGETEAIVSDAGACLDDNAVSDLSFVEDNGVGVQNAVVAYLSVRTDENTWVNGSVFSNRDIFGYCN